MKRTLNAIVKFIGEADMFMLVLCIISSVYGIVLIYSSTRTLHSDTSVYIQIISLLIGIGLYILFSYIDVDTIADRSKILYVLSFLFILSLFFFGTSSGGNRAWIRFSPSAGIQPAEVVKIPYTIILAKMISEYKNKKTLNTPVVAAHAA